MPTKHIYLSFSRSKLKRVFEAEITRFESLKRDVASHKIYLLVHSRIQNMYIYNYFLSTSMRMIKQTIECLENTHIKEGDNIKKSIFITTNELIVLENINRIINNELITIERIKHDFKSSLKKEKTYKRVYSNMDPYGEEDWTN